MAKLPYFPFYPSDFDSDTQLLSDAEVGAYVRLLNIQWKKGKIPISKLPRIMEDYDSTWDEISEFFIIEKGLVFNNRLEEERVIAIGRHEKAMKANNARWNAPSNAPSNPTDDPPAIPTQNSELITNNTEPELKKSVLLAHDAFKKIYDKNKPPSDYSLSIVTKACHDYGVDKVIKAIEIMGNEGWHKVSLLEKIIKGELPEKKTVGKKMSVYKNNGEDQYKDL